MTVLQSLQSIAAAAQALHRAAPVQAVVVHPAPAPAHHLAVAHRQVVQAVHQATHRHQVALPATRRAARTQAVPQTRQAAHQDQQAQTVAANAFSFGQSLHLEKVLGLLKRQDALADVLSQPAQAHTMVTSLAILGALKPNLTGHDVRTPEGWSL